jgi:hypothetical protein
VSLRQVARNRYGDLCEFDESVRELSVADHCRESDRTLYVAFVTTLQVLIEQAEHTKLEFLVVLGRRCLVLLLGQSIGCALR